MSRRELVEAFAPTNPDHDTVLETWVAGDGKRHRLRFDGVTLVVEDSTGYRDIGYVWAPCPWGHFHIPDFNDNATGGTDAP